MANCCDFDANLKFDTEEQAEAFAKETGGCEHPGCVELPGGRCVFDGGIERTGHMVYIFGWVKWAMYEEDMIAIVRGAPGLKSVFAEIREDGNQVKGCYEWGRSDPEALVWRVLLPEDWPEWKDEYLEDIEEFDDELDHAFSHKARTFRRTFAEIERERAEREAASEAFRKNPGPAMEKFLRELDETRKAFESKKEDSE